MTLQEIQALTDDEIRVRVAELCGWVRHGCYWLKPGSRNTRRLLDYHADLNACAEAVNSIPDDGSREKYLWALKRIIMRTSDTQGADDFQVHTAPARARCESFLAVMQP